MAHPQLIGHLVRDWTGSTICDVIQRWIGESGGDVPEVTVVKTAVAVAGGDRRLASGPVFDDSMTRAILVKRIVDSIVMVISHVFANESE